jgi:hypothetical protein
LKARLEEQKIFLISYHDQDRDAYQKLLADYNSLEQRTEALEAEIARLQRVGTNASGAKKGHQRYLSDTSTASATSELPDEIDVRLVLKLQQKLKDVKKERSHQQKRVEYLEKEDSPSDDAARTHYSFKLQEM